MKDVMLYLRLRKMEMLASLTDEEVKYLANHSILKKMTKGHKIYAPDDVMQHVFLVEKGNVRIGNRTKSRQFLIKEYIRPEMLFGENIFSGKTVQKEFAEAHTDGLYFEIEMASFKKLMFRNSEFCKTIVESLAEKLLSIEKRVQNFVFKKAQKRIHDYLRNFAKDFGVKIGLDEILINLHMSHTEIANVTDTSRQTVARVLGELKAAHVIHFTNRKTSKILIRRIDCLS